MAKGQPILIFCLCTHIDIVNIAFEMKLLIQPIQSPLFNARIKRQRKGVPKERSTLESGINVAPRINGAPGNVGKNNKRSPITLYL